MDTPGSAAASRADTPLASSFLADSIFLSVINRFLPPVRPISLATLSPARVLSMFHFG
jgi:hypothetical protein